MKIAISFRGPIRPSISVAKENISHLLKQFEGHDVDSYLISWKDDNLSYFYKDDLIDNIVSFKEPRKEFIAEKLTSKSLMKGNIFERAYKMFWSQKTVLECIKATNIDYDVLVISRVDMKVDILDMKKCLSEKKYVTPGNKEIIKKFNSGEKNMGIVDVFAMGPFQVLENVRDYKNLDNLNEFYGSSYGNGGMLNNMLIKSKEEYCFQEIEFNLNENRHYRDKEYPYRYRQMAYNYLIKPVTKIFGDKFTYKVAEKIRKIFPAKAKDFRNNKK